MSTDQMKKLWWESLTFHCLLLCSLQQVSWMLLVCKVRVRVVAAQAPAFEGSSLCSSPFCGCVTELIQEMEPAYGSCRHRCSCMGGAGNSGGTEQLLCRLAATFRGHYPATHVVWGSCSCNSSYCNIRCWDINYKVKVFPGNLFVELRL